MGQDYTYAQKEIHVKVLLDCYVIYNLSKSMFFVREVKRNV